MYSEITHMGYCVKNRPTATFSIDLSNKVVDAFNRMNLDDVVNFFATDGVYEDSTGGRHVGHEAIRTAFEPLVGGSRGKIRFDGEDIFVEAESGKVLASWRLNLDKDGSVSVIRGIDILEFTGDKLKRKGAYMKVDKPHLEPA
ncbi:MAG: nuclear transport factor 2 family protein [Gammaproteobacteria bacterium]|nr:nuclear transport factor 2 family protein [Gammaproteobacteria bacterium]